MKIAYASRTGNVESIVAQLDMESVRIDSGNETLAEDYVLFTYTDGYGDVPAEVEAFLAGNAMFLKGVVVSGDTGYGEAYCLAVTRSRKSMMSNVCTRWRTPAHRKTLRPSRKSSLLCKSCVQTNASLSGCSPFTARRY